MEVRDWRVAIITANKLEEQIISSVLRGAGAASLRVIRDNSAGFETFGDANLLILSENAAPLDCFEWVWLLRRIPYSARKLPVFMVSGALTVASIEKCKNAGANAIIGQPVSAAAILNVIKKVLNKPRPFIEADGYAGPCRRAGIAVAGAGAHRRKADIKAA
jgi:CheY-like chemotaxis protein